MSDGDSDPWAVWYQGYLGRRAGIRAAQQRASERRKAANIVAVMLFAYMVIGGALASIAVGLVMAH